MKQSSEKIIRKYVKDVEKDLECSKALSSVFKKRFFEEIYDFAEKYNSNGKAITYEDLARHFGSPKEVANGFLSRSDYEELLKKSKRKALFWKCAALIGIVLLIIVVILLILVALDAGGKITVSGTMDF